MMKISNLSYAEELMFRGGISPGRCAELLEAYDAAADHREALERNARELKRAESIQLDEILETHDIVGRLDDIMELSKISALDIAPVLRDIKKLCAQYDNLATYGWQLVELRDLI